MLEQTKAVLTLLESSSLKGIKKSSLLPPLVSPYICVLVSAVCPGLPRTSMLVIACTPRLNHVLHH